MNLILPTTGWADRVSKMHHRISQTEEKFQRCGREHADLLLAKELGDAKAPKQIAALEKKMEQHQKTLSDTRKTLLLAEARKAEEDRKIEDERRSAWLANIEELNEERAQLCRKADRELDAFLETLEEIDANGKAIISEAGHKEAKRLLDLPAFKDRLMASFGWRLAKYFDIRGNPMSRDAQVPIGVLEARARKGYMDVVSIS